MAYNVLKGKSRLDKVFRKVMRSSFFNDGIGGFGKVEKLIEFHKIMSNRDECYKLVPMNYPVIVTKIAEDRDYKVITGHLRSPFVAHMPGFLPPESETSHFQLVVPRIWKTDDKPVAIHLAGTGDHHFWRRRQFMAKDLVDSQGVGSLILENPFYGLRKPAEQLRSNLRYVSDIFVMGGGLILESIAILRWLDKNGFGPFCMTGISMGGHMASLAVSNWPMPIPLVICLSWASASAVFTRGVMSGGVNWDSVQRDYQTNTAYRDILLGRLSNFKLEPKEDSISAAAKIANSKKRDRAKSILWNAFLKVMDALGLSRLRPNRPPLFPFKPSPSSSVEYNPGKTSFSLLRFFSFVKLHSQSSGRSGNFEREYLKSKDFEKHPAEFWNYFIKPETPERRETKEFMRRIMDHFTHIANFSTPVDPELIIAVVARDDAYVIRDGITPINEIWKGCQIRVVEGGHVKACLMDRDVFRAAIVETMDLYRQKYNRDGTPKNSTTNQ